MVENLGHIYSKTSFDDYKLRVKIKVKTLTDEFDYQFDVYTTNNDKFQIEQFIQSKLSDKVSSFEIIHWTTKEQDDATERFIEYVDLMSDLNDFKHILNQNPIFIEGYKPYDFTKNRGQYGLEITFTNGDTQMLTTPSTKDNVNDIGDISEDQFWSLTKILEKQFKN